MSVAPVKDRRNQRNALLAAFIGWTLDAFDYFILTFVIDDVARSFGKTRPDIALALTLALATRPVGAIVFGIAADRYGRRVPLMINVICYSVISVMTGLAPSYGVFLACRLLFGVAMGGEWGVGASLALESASAERRGLLSGLIQEGYALGNLLAALVFRVAYPTFVAHYGSNGWRVMFFIGGLPALLSLFIRSKVKESEAWREHRTTDWTAYRRSLLAHWPRFTYLVLMLTMMGFIAHGTQDMYPTLLRSVSFDPRQIADITMFSLVGAIVGGLVFGHYSDRWGRRRAMIVAVIGCLAVVPLWVAGHNVILLVIGGFLMQFFVQGAWGVVPAHVNELSPPQARGFMPGFSYQMGILFSASIPYVEAMLGEKFTYVQAMGGLMIAVFVTSMIVILFGPEARGISFRGAGDGDGGRRPPERQAEDWREQGKIVTA